jgi:hypothetical protein
MVLQECILAKVAPRVADIMCSAMVAPRVADIMYSDDKLKSEKPSKGCT